MLFGMAVFPRNVRVLSCAYGLYHIVPWIYNSIKRTTFLIYILFINIMVENNHVRRIHTDAYDMN